MLHCPRTVAPIIIGLIVVAFSLMLPIQPPAAAQNTCAGAIPIAEARTRPLDTAVTVQGVVGVPTGVFTEGQSFAVRMPAGEFYVYAAAGDGDKRWPRAARSAVSRRLAEHHGLRLRDCAGQPRAGHPAGHERSPLPPRACNPARWARATESRLVQLSRWSPA